MLFNFHLDILDHVHLETLLNEFPFKSAKLTTQHLLQCPSSPFQQKLHILEFVGLKDKVGSAVVLQHQSSNVLVLPHTLSKDNGCQVPEFVLQFSDSLVRQSVNLKGKACWPSNKKTLTKRIIVLQKLCISTATLQGTFPETTAEVKSALLLDVEYK